MYGKMSFGFVQNMGAKMQDDVTAPTERTGITRMPSTFLSVIPDVDVILYFIVVTIWSHDR